MKTESAERWPRNHVEPELTDRGPRLEDMCSCNCHAMNSLVMITEVNIGWGGGRCQRDRHQFPPTRLRMYFVSAVILSDAKGIAIRTLRMANGADNQYLYKVHEGHGDLLVSGEAFVFRAMERASSQTLGRDDMVYGVKVGSSRYMRRIDGNIKPTLIVATPGRSSSLCHACCRSSPWNGTRYQTPHFLFAGISATWACSAVRLASTRPSAWRMDNICGISNKPPPLFLEDCHHVIGITLLLEDDSIQKRHTTTVQPARVRVGKGAGQSRPGFHYWAGAAAVTGVDAASLPFHVLPRLVESLDSRNQETFDSRRSPSHGMGFVGKAPGVTNPEH
ncbi:hypothetical protein SODALDRAFT_354474 [Sodiomyces alkalinus F11]|uniref:Uncharacterized protein n=1 Tax=Sodiomyces alkalinus (strain CBS 110278 / VKM F-3762 / F11) TaxID=1314773 RepID=A0A3N2Q6E6_SODAK|nr:hypothetical protein SODALDRAFT_354474 [Sodiomyces alkalinus F11]ROT42341.1 hypothetical protein SODALDRAFT_354474 [Sodiomyces alkalinus F11]